MTAACHYAIVRFMPFVETGEFANVGVVLLAAKARHFGFRLLTNRHARVTNFFEELDPKVFKAAMRIFRDELTRIEQAFKGLGTDRRLRELDKDGALALWHELIKPKETMLRFGEPRLVLTGDPRAQLNQLFEYYVERTFVTREYQEQLLDRGVRRLLRDANLQHRYAPARVGNDEYHAQFPFVARDNEHVVRVIKPLNLAYPDAARIIDHGGQWVLRVNQLKKRNLLPEHVLFAVEGPDDGTVRGRAKREVVDELEEAGVLVAPIMDTRRVIEFARWAA